MNNDKDLKEQLLQNATIRKGENNLSNLKKVIQKWLYLKDPRTVDVLLGTYIANLLPGDPVWLFYVSPPGGTKTELLKTIKTEETIEVGNVTEHTFLSGQKTTGKEPSLIKQIERDKKKMMFMKDFTSIMSQRKESMSVILSHLREIYDGDITKQFGTGKTVTWQGKLGFIAGVTNVIDAHFGIMNSLGGRFIQWRPGHNRREERAKAIANTGKEDQMRLEMKDIAQNLIIKIKRKLMDKKYYQEIKEKIDPLFIGDLAEYSAVLRTHVNRDWKTAEIKNYPHPEIATRLGKNYITILIGLLMVREKTEVSEDEYDIMRKIAQDTVPEIRNKIIEVMYAVNEKVTTSDVSKELQLPTSTARRKLEDMTALGFIIRIAGRQGKANEWILSDECKQIINDTNIF